MSDTEYDAALGIALDKILPPSDELGDWQQVLTDASSRSRRPTPSRRRRLAVALAATAVGALVPIAALAASNGWWFFNSSTSPPVPAPVGPVVVVRSGSWDGVRWAVTAYRTSSDGLCMAFTPNPPTGVGSTRSPQTPVATLMMTCGAEVKGIPGLGDATTMHQFAFASSASSASAGRRFNAVAGIAAVDVASIEIHRTGGPPIIVRTYPAPKQLDVPIRFFVAKLPLGQALRLLVARDSGGNTLETVSVSSTSIRPSHGTTGPSESGSFTWGS